MHAKFLSALVVASSALVSMAAQAEDPSAWVREQMQMAASQARTETVAAPAQPVGTAAPADSKATAKPTANVQASVASKTTAQ